ncbi:MAG: hypothetical protein NTW59_01240 [Candidatus Diapherotrites archaeon]|nr:hypothetical protein [Candidatus Diapherotrites archaeon]
MGLFDKLTGKKEEGAAEQKKEKAAAEPAGKYNEPCALCGKLGTEKKWMGQYWHKKCMRGARKAAKGMI